MIVAPAGRRRSTAWSAPDEVLDALEAAGYRELSPMAHARRTSTG